MRTYNEISQYGWNGMTAENAEPCGGNVWYVDGNSGNAANTASAGQGESWELPFANINYAVQRCSDDESAVILVAADHTETITATGTVSSTTTTQLVIDKNGVTIVGMGRGDRRPTISISTATTAEVKVDATEVTLKNLLFVSAIADLETLIEVATGATGFQAEDCEFRDGGTILEAIDCISLAADCDDAIIRGCRFITTDTADTTKSAIAMAGGVDRMVIEDCWFYGDWGGGGFAVIEGGTAASIGIRIDRNFIYNLDATKGEGITMHGDTTGAISNNVIYTTAAASSPLIAAKCVKSDNMITNVLLVEAGPQGSSGAVANGNDFYVDAGTGVDTASGLSWSDAMATVDAAIALCTDGYGDVIHVAKGHTENVATATVVTCDKTHMSIVGEGTGEERPLITFITNAEAMYTVTADAVRIENMRFGCNITNQSHMINVDGDDCQIINCEFIENGQVPLTAITADTTGGDGHGNNLLVKGCRIYGPTATNWDAGIEIAQDFEGIVIEDNYIMGDFDAACIEIPVAGNANQDMVINGNTLINEQVGLYCIRVEETALAVTGICANNFLISSNRKTALKPNILNCFGNFWQNVTTRVAPVALEGDITTPGQNIYVNSSHTQAVDDAAHGGSWDHPLALIEYANTNRMTANNNDIIHVGPGHEEIVTDAAPLAFDTEGVTVIGYGTGQDKPRITLDTNTTAVVDIGADGVILKNFLFRPSINAVAVGVDILDGFEYCEIIDCDFGPPVTSTDEFTMALQIGAGSNYSVVRNCRFMAGAQAADTAITYNDASAYGTVEDCLFTGAYATCQIEGLTNPITNWIAKRNTFYCTGTTDNLNLQGSSTGIFSKNIVAVNATTFAAALDMGSVLNCDNIMIADADIGGAACDNRYVAAASVTETLDG